MPDPAPKRLRIDQVPQVDEATRLAVRAFVRGHSTGAQATMVANFILNQLCGMTAYQPATLGEREAGFLSGKQWVGYTLASIADIRLFEAHLDEE